MTAGPTDSPSRILLVHAHPDDETLTTGGTIAHYSRRGVEVTVLTCTLGEEGEVIGAQWAGLVADAADQLGGYRIYELAKALAELGVAGPRFLGGAGRWRDSGMVDTPSLANPRAFVAADVDEAVAEMVLVLSELRPHVVITYDARGGYGHPDHIQAHRITTAAVAAAAASGQWDTPKLYWTVSDRAATQAGLAAMGPVPAEWHVDPTVVDAVSVASAEVTSVVDIADVLDAKRAALHAHATQVTVAPSGCSYALSNNIAWPLLAEEHFVLARGTLGPLDSDGREHDLLGGLT